MYCQGSELLNYLKHGQTAICVGGLYIHYSIYKHKYGNNLYWANDEPIVDNGLTDPYFKYSKWKIVVDEQ